MDWSLQSPDRRTCQAGLQHRQLVSTQSHPVQCKLYLLVAVGSLGSEDQFRSLLMRTDKETVRDLLLEVRRSPEGGSSSCGRCGSGSSNCGSRRCGYLKRGKICFSEFYVCNILQLL